MTLSLLGCDPADLLQALTQVSHAASNAVSLDQLLQLAGEQAAVAVGAERSLVLLTDDVGRLTVRARYPVAEIPRAFAGPLDERLLPQLASMLGDISPESVLAVPLVVRGLVTGLVAVGPLTGIDSSGPHEAILTALADQMAAPLENARLAEEVYDARLIAENARRAADVGTFEFNLSLDQLTWSEETYRLHGLSLGTPLSTSRWLAAIHPHDRARMQALVADPPAESGASTDFIENEYRVVRPDGGVRWLVLRARLVFGEDGRSARRLGVVLDITERKQVEAAVHENEERFRLVTEALAGFLYDYDLISGQVERFGDVEEILGFKAAAIPSTPDWWRGRIHPEDISQLIRAVTDAVNSDATRYAHEYRMQHRQGHYIYIGDRGRIIRDQAGRAVRLLGGVSDITDRKRTEEALGRVTSRLEVALQGSGIGIWELELTDGTLENARIVYTNVFEQLGYGPPGSPPDVSAITELIHPEDRGRIVKAYRSALAGETDNRELEYRLRHQDGSYRTMLMRGVAVYDATGKPTRLIGSRIDITDRKRADAALEQSEERFRIATEALAGFIYDWDPIRDQVQYFGGLVEVLGFRPDEVPQDGSWWTARIHPRDLPNTQYMGDALLHGTALSWAIEYNIRHRDGHYVEVVDRCRVVHDYAGRVIRVVGGVYGVSERRRLEREREALLERERVAREAAEAAAHERDTVLGIVSHDLGTPLSTIAMCATSLRNQAEPLEDPRKAVDLIDRAVAYMHHLIRDLSDVASIEAGHLALHLREECPAAIVGEVAEMLAGVALDRGVALETKIGAGLPSIRADAARVVQGLANLVTNAVQFTARGGSVTVRAEGDLTAVRFTVEDTGLGISADDLPHIFDRYWQKRPRAIRHGTGLGLAITRGIIEAHGGTLRAESTAGVGSRFTFTIPVLK